MFLRQYLFVDLNRQKLFFPMAADSLASSVLKFPESNSESTVASGLSTSRVHAKARSGFVEQLAIVILDVVRHVRNWEGEGNDHTTISDLSVVP